MKFALYSARKLDYSDQPWLSRNAKKYCSIGGCAISSRHLTPHLCARVEIESVGLQGRTRRIVKIAGGDF